MNAGGANGGGDGNAPAGTEYTLQGEWRPPGGTNSWGGR
jgi:striatin 1/3/4